MLRLLKETKYQLHVRVRVWFVSGSCLVRVRFVLFGSYLFRVYFGVVRIEFLFNSNLNDN